LSYIGILDEPDTVKIAGVQRPPPPPSVNPQCVITTLVAAADAISDNYADNSDAIPCIHCVQYIMRQSIMAYVGCFLLTSHAGRLNSAVINSMVHLYRL